MFYNISNRNIKNNFHNKKITSFEKDVEKFIKKIRDCYYNKIKWFENLFYKHKQIIFLYQFKKFHL